MKKKQNTKSTIIDFSHKNEIAKNEFITLKHLILQTSKCFSNNLFLIVNNIKYNNMPFTTSICDFTDAIPLILIDEIVWLSNSPTNSNFANYYKSILWFSHKQGYDFNKDYLRVEHIWKEVEWGKRKENYHPLGKDPGNIWLKEYSEKAIISKQEFYTPLEIYSKLIISQIKDNKETFYIYSVSKINLSSIRKQVKDKTALIPIIKSTILQ